MCARYSLTVPTRALAEIFDFHNRPNLEPRWNVAPTQAAAVVRRDRDGRRELAMLRWGLVPGFARDASGAARLINARSETAAVKPSFRQAWASRRCLVPADGFYEWQAIDGGKQAWRIGLRGGAVLALAGLWDNWIDPETGQGLQTFTVLTCPANQRLAAFHERMPVILAPADWAAWLDPATPPARLHGLMRTFPVEAMAWYRVSPHVNAVRNDDPACFAPQAAARLI